MNTAKILDLKKILTAPKKVVIVPHKNPDGDAMGSTLGLYHYLKKLGHSTTVIAPNDYPEFLKWIPGTDEVLIYETETSSSETFIAQADLIFTLDFNALHRCGAMESPIKNAEAIKVMIDHHREPQGFDDYRIWTINTSSASELIYHFIKNCNGLDEITPEGASCIYAGIMTDTGSFRFPTTSSKTHRIIADLMDAGAVNQKI